MSRNRRRSLPSSSVPSDEDQTTPAVQKGSSQTTLRSRSLSRQDLLVQASSIYENETQTDLPQMVDVAVGTSARTPSSIILDWSTSRTSLRRSHWNTGDLPLRTFPHILVEAPEGDEPKDTNPPASAPLEPISEVPYVEPTFEKPLSFIERPPSVKRTPASIEPDRNSSDSSVPSSFAQSTIAQESRLKFVSVVSVESVTSISATEQYDREEPLITKTQKFFKKRAPLVPRYDSEDSYVIDKDVIQQDASVSATSAGYPLADTESPGSFSEYDEDRRKNSVLFDSISDDSKESFDLIRGGRRLGSGMVFVNLYGDSTRRRLRLGDNGALLSRPADHRRPYLHHWHPVAVYSQGSGRQNDGGTFRGQCPDWILLHERYIWCHYDQSLWFPQGGHRRGPILLIHGLDRQLQRQPGHADMLLQRPWWHLHEHDLGEFPADRGVLLRAVSSDGHWILLQRRRRWNSSVHIPQRLAGADYRMEEHAPHAVGADHVDPADCHYLRGGGSHSGGPVPPSRPFGVQFGGVLRQLLCAGLLAYVHPDGNKSECP
ncbi:uncharacterized protein LOC119549604 isoform X8 [Drosophila subpulchrella]|uniref:uncharacterized protein LOC119549604 isoform X8 n=1 Tax=Drosophila subpulchrella TaxID=1486046 RepID=UPI0018A195BA|nr:uncharacterized protein LOC119549604 isoform X8 [Drosophila subpulchrella]